MECPIIDYCGLTPSKEFYNYRCRNHYNQCESYKEWKRIGMTQIDEDVEFVGRLESLGEQEQLEVFNE